MDCYVENGWIRVIWSGIECCLVRSEIESGVETNKCHVKYEANVKRVSA